MARFLEKHYALALPLNCRMLNRGFNDVYSVVSADDQRYVFRLSHHRARGAADMKSETDFLVHLARSGVAVASPVPTRDGALFVIGQSPEGAREAVLFHALDGRAPDAASTADARANGKTLALLHNAAETFAVTAPLYRLDLDHLLRRPLARVRGAGIVDDAGVIARLEAAAARTAERIESLGHLTWTYCHGDCHGFNARITEAGAAVFFDFDDGGPGYLAYDLAVFLWAKVSFGRNFHAAWHAFLDAYRSIRPVCANDLEAVQAFVIVRHIWLMGEYASRAREWGSEPVKWITREIEFLEAWEAQHLVSWFGPALNTSLAI